MIAIKILSTQNVAKDNVYKISTQSIQDVEHDY